MFQPGWEHLIVVVVVVVVVVVAVDVVVDDVVVDVVVGLFNVLLHVSFPKQVLAHPANTVRIFGCRQRQHR